MCCAPIGAGKAINGAVTGSQQHIVFLLHQRRKKQGSSHFLQTVNLLVYSIPNLLELNIFVRHKYHLSPTPLCVNTEANQTKGSNKHTLTREVSHKGWGHNTGDTNCPLQNSGPGQWAVGHKGFLQSSYEHWKSTINNTMYQVWLLVSSKSRVD